MSNSSVSVCSSCDIVGYGSITIYEMATSISYGNFIVTDIGSVFGFSEYGVRTTTLTDGSCSVKNVDRYVFANQPTGYIAPDDSSDFFKQTLSSLFSRVITTDCNVYGYSLDTVTVQVPTFPVSILVQPTWVAQPGPPAGVLRETTTSLASTGQGPSNAQATGSPSQTPTTPSEDLSTTGKALIGTLIPVCIIAVIFVCLLTTHRRKTFRRSRDLSAVEHVLGDDPGTKATHFGYTEKPELHGVDRTELPGSSESTQHELSSTERYELDAGYHGSELSNDEALVANT